MQNFKQKIKIIFFIFLASLVTSAYADFLDESAIALENRIAPIGKVKLSSSTSSISSLTTSNIKTHLGKTLFKSKCALCHSHGLAGAPRLGNKADWQPRIKKKIFTLTKTRNNGISRHAAQRGLFRVFSRRLRGGHSLHARTTPFI